MKKLITLLLAVSLLLPLFVKAGEDITNKQLAGKWNLTDVNITNSPAAEKKVTYENCYLCDIYKAQMGLVFTEDGKVDYSNYGNQNKVRYTINGNVLSLFAETQTAGESETSTEFVASLSGDVLTLTRIFPDFTETYTFTK